MGKNNNNITISNVDNMLKEEGGLYSVNKPLTVSEFVKCAKHLIAGQYTDSIEVSGSQMSKDYFITALAMHEEEKFAVLFLDKNHHVIAFEILFSGTVDGAKVYPRVLIKRALTHNAAALILGHNHPSGDLTASLADIKLTEELKKLLALLDIRILDHIIVAGHRAVSLEEAGRI